MAAGGTLSDAVNRAGGVIHAQVKTAAFVASIDDVFRVAMLVSIVSSIPFLFLKSVPRAKKTPSGTTNSGGLTRPGIDMAMNGSPLRG